MENTRYDYSAIITRKPFKLPNQARVAVWVVLNVEHFDIGSLFPGGKAASPPDMQAYSARDYGNRIGIWRIMEVLDKHNIKASVSLNADICDHYPIIVEECIKRDWEIMCHGITNSRLLSGLSEAEEREVIAQSMDTITRAVGKRPKGWRSPGMTTTFHTPDILAAEGIRYMSDWSNDDQPYPLKVKKGSLISLPADDVPDLRFTTFSPSQYYEFIKEHFDTLYREGADQARTYAFCLHTFEMGRPSRISSMDRVLQYMKDHQDVWFATGWEIASWYYENYLGVKES